VTLSDRNCKTCAFVFRKTAISAALIAALLGILLIPAAVAAPKASKELTLLQAVNATRQAHGLRPLRLDPRLQRAARSWSGTLLRSNAFTHGDFASRMQSLGIQGLAGENLAWGSGSYATAGTVVAMWLASPGHRANLLKPSYRRIGIGIARGTFQGQAAASVVTADFGG
jgi:uncharacterized protein YkwD